MISGRGNIVSFIKLVSLKLKATLIRKLLLGAGCWVLVSVTSVIGQTNYYSKAAGNLNLVATWGQNADGSGPNPSDFISPNQIFNIRNNATPTIGANWTVSGAGSKVIVGNGLAACTFTVPGALIFTATCDISNNGTLKITSTNATPYSGTLTVNGGGTYEHAKDGGTIPAATWDPNSSCNITGIVTAASTIGGLGQTFGNFTWNCANQGPGNFYLASDLTIAGSFTVLSTGAVNDHTQYSLRMSNSATGYTMNVSGNVVIGNGVVGNTPAFKMSNSSGLCTMNVGGNFTLNSGNFTIVTGTVNSILNVTGNVNISGGLLVVKEDAPETFGTLNVKGNFTLSGGSITLLNAATGIDAVYFNGNTTQTFLKTAGTIVDKINFAVNSGSILDVGTSVIDGAGNFSLNAGAGIITAHTQGLSTTALTGSIQVSGTKTFSTGANYTYNGSLAQVTGNALTGANNLTINNSNSSGVSLSNAVSIAGTLALTNGILTTTGANLLSVTNISTSAISGGSATTFINGPVKWTLPSNLVSGSTYNFPIGKGATYLPFSLVNPTTGAGVVTSQAEAFTGNSGGGIDAATLASKSASEYWSLVTTANFTNSSVSLTRQTAIAPLDAIGGSSTVAGTYTSLAGTAGTYGVTSSNSIGANRFFELAEKIQTISTGVISGSPFCAGANVSVPFTITGTFTAGNIFTAQLSDASGNFGSPVTIGSLTQTTAGTIPGTIPGGTLTGTLYRIRVVSNNPVRTGAPNGSDLSINPQPVGPTLNLATPNTGTVCNGTLVSATFNAGSGGVGCADEYQYRFDGGGWVVYIPGNTLNTTGHTSVDIQGRRAGCTGTGCTGTAWVTLANWTVNSIPNAPSVTNNSRCGTGTVTLKAGGAGGGENYKWYDALTGGNLLQTDGSNFPSPTISSTTNFYVAIYNTATSCESSRALVVATIMDEPLVTLGYAFQKTLTIDGSKVVGTNNNFPVLIHLTDNDLKANVKSPLGYDIIFSDINYNKLDFNLESYTPGTGDLLVWVRIPNLSNGVNTPIRMFYGNPQISTDQSSPGTWEHGYSGIWHLGTNFLDASSNGNNGTNSGTTNIAGIFAGGKNFDATTDYISVGTTNMSAASGSVEAWANTNSPAGPTGESYIFGHTTPPYSDPSYHERIQLYLKSSTNQLALGLGEGAGGHDIQTNIATLANGTWNHIVLNWDGINYEVFVNGVSKVTGTFTGLSSLNTFADIGNDGNPLERNEGWNGIIDEVRISRLARSAGWIQTEYNNQNNPAGFLTSISGQTVNSVYDFEVCENSTGVVYSVPNQANHSYSWNVIGGTVVGAGNSITVNWGAAGAGSISLTTTNTTTGCSATSPVYSVVKDPNPSPVISGNLTVCPNKTNEIYSTPDIAGHSYSWSVTGAVSFTGDGTHQISVNWGAGPLGTISLTETIDATGCSLQTNANVTIQDNTPPVVSGCPTDITVTTGPGHLTCDQTATWVEPTALDNCLGAMTFTTRNHAPGSTFPVGTTAVIYTFTDASLNTSTCTFNVIVQDNTPPVISGCPTDITVTTGPGHLTCDQTATWVEPTALDNCIGAMTFTTRNHAPGSTFPVGTTAVIYTFTDASSNTSTCTFNVIVQDNTPPVISGCPTDITVTTGPGHLTCDQTATWVEPTALDNCQGAMTFTTRNHAPGSTFPVGSTAVIYTFTDASLNTSTCTFNVIVQDNTPPVISGCPTDITVTTGPGHLTCDQTATWVEPTALDNCQGAMTFTTRNYAPGSTFPVGTTAVIYTFTDASLNTSTCTFNVIVQDNTPPVISGCPTDITVTTGPGHLTCNQTATWVEPTALDNCQGAMTFTTRNHAPGSTFPVGTTAVIYTFTDASLNTSTCTFNVIVQDNTPPVISGCPTDITVTTGPGHLTCDQTATWVEPTALDNCLGAMTFTTRNHAPGSTFPVGTTAVIYTFTDASLNTSTCTFNVIVQDNTPPVISGCPTDITVTTGPGHLTCDQTATWVEPTALDNCMGAMTFTTRNHAPGSTFPVGTTAVIYTFTDASLNTSTCTFNVIVQDNTPPVISGCPTDITVTTGPGHLTCDQTATWVEPTALDNCLGAMAFTTRNHAPGSTFPVGTTAVIYTFTDASLNTSTCTFNVIVQDNTPPVISGCPTDITVTTGPGHLTCDQTATWVEPTALDNCLGAMTFTTRNHAPGSTFPVGTTAVIYTFTDASLNTSTCTFNVIVQDNTPPVISGCPTDITVTTGPGHLTCDQTATWVEPTALDNCQGAMTFTTRNHAPGSTFPVGTTAVIYTFTDASLNTSTCTFNVIVQDNTPPVISGCPTDITVTTGPGHLTCDQTATWVEPTALDNCQGAMTFTTRNYAPGSTFPVGTTAVIYTFTDASSNTSTCTFNVIVQDNTPPVISGCPTDITVTTGPGHLTCDQTATWVEPTALDNCLGAMAFTTRNHAPGSTFPVGTTAVIYTFTDASLNTSTCTFNVIVQDNTPPVISGCPTDITVTTGPGHLTCDQTATWVEPTALDNCIGAMTFTTRNHAPGSTFPVGTTAVIYTFTDASLNTSTCTFNVIVQDNTPPVISGCPTDITVTTGPGHLTCNQTATWVEPTALDNCQGAMTFTTRNHAPGSTFPVGTTAVIYTFTDASLNTSTCTFNVIVQDNTPPVISGCPTDITVTTGPGHLTCDQTATWVEPTALDNCLGAMTFTTRNHAPGSTFPVGTTAVIYTFTDASLNTSTCTFNVIVQDNTPPVISGCPTDITVTTGPGHLTCDQTATWVEPTALDNCQGAMTFTTRNYAPGSTFPVGTTAVIYTFTDASLNTSTCTFNVIVQDNTPPVISGCPTDIVQSNDAGLCSAVVTWTEPTATDNCTASGSLIWTKSHIPGSVFPVGLTTVTYTATDASSNVSSVCSFTIRVNDTQLPTITCPADILQNDDPGLDNALVIVPNALIADNCAVTQLTWTMTGATVATSPAVGINQIGTFTFNTGVTTVTYTVKDAAGNLAICNFIVTIIDNIIPTITCPADISQNDDAGVCNASVIVPNAIIADNFSVASLTWVMSGATVATSPGVGINQIGTFTFNTGLTSVTYTVKDPAGNQATCNFTVTITDNIVPTISCPANILHTADAGLCNYSVAVGLPVTSDNCGVLSVVGTRSDALLLTDPYPVGLTTIHWVVTDIHSNNISCDQTVTVTDDELPIAICKNINIDLDLLTGLKTISAADINNGSYDNCGIASISASETNFDCTNIGANNVTLTVTDIHGNISTCNAVVTVDYAITPDPIATPASDVICNGGTTNFILTNNIPVTSWTWTVAAPPQVTGGSDDLTGTKSSIQQTLINSDDIAHKVVYTIVPKVYNSCNLSSFTAEVWVEPTPQASISTTTPIICDGSNINVTINSPTITTAPGNLSYVVGVTSTDAGHLGGTASTGFTVVKTDLPFTINGTLTNSSDAPIVVTYTVTPKLGGCTDGPSQIVTVTVNPTPQVVPSTLTQTICNDGTTNVTLASPSTFTSGLITFDYTVLATGGVTGFTTPQNGLPKDHLIADVLHNPTDAPQTVTYTIVPISPTGCAAGPSKVVVITVEPTPQASISTTTPIICDGSNINVTINSPTITTAPGNLSYVVGVTSTDAAHLGGTASTGFTLVKTDLPFIINGTLTNSSDAPIVVTYTVTPKLGGCSDGPSQIVTVTVNPTPQVVPSTLAQTICNDGTTNVTLASPGTFTSGVITFNYTVVATGGVTGFTTPQNGLPKDYIIADLLHNPTDDPQTVTYTIVPISPTGCAAGPIKVVVITVNPTPQVVPSTLAQTICNDGTTSVTLASPSTFTSGVITFNYTVVATGGITGFTTPQNGLPKDQVIADVLHNPTDAPQTVTYTIVPISPTGCAAGPIKVVVITVDPTPQVVPSTLAQTICNDGTTSVTLGSPSTFTSGVITFNYTVVATGGVTGFITPQNGLPKDQVIADVLHNPTDNPQTVTYTIVPISPTGCAAGPTKVVVITVDPTPQVVPSTLTQTICNDGTTSVTLASPSTFTSGVITFNYTVVATGGVTGFTTPQNGLPKDQVIADVLHNPTDDPQTVTYTIVPISPTGCAAGPSKVVVITVEPTPQASISTTTPIICDGSNINVTINSPTITTAPGNLSYVVGVTSTDAAHLGGTASTGFTVVKTDLPFTISGTLTNSSDVPIVVTYTVTPKLGGCSDGPSQLVTVTVNPTPQVVPSTLAQTICNDGTTNVTLASPSTFTSGVITFNYTVVATGGVTGFTTPQNGLPKDYIIADVLHNPTDNPQTVTYTIVPISPTGCAAGPTKVVVITVNPTPQVVPSTLAQTICNDGTTNVTLGSPSTFSNGLITFNYTVIASGGVTGFTTPVTGLPKDHVIADILHNPTDAPQTVIYIVTPISPGGCAAGPSKVVIVTVNPTPQVVPSTLAQTICNDGTTNVTLASPSTFTSGVITFNYTVVATGGVTGFTTPQNGLPKDHVIADVLHNPTDAPQTVTYTIVPISPTGCSAGPTKVVVITVNPTPQVIPSTLAQTICNDGTTNVTLTSPSTFTTGVITFNYTVVATGGVTGFTTPQNGLPKDHVIADVLHNPTDAPQTVTYTIVPISPTGCAAGPTKVVVITVNPTPQVFPSTLAQTICNDGTTNVTLASPSTFTSGVITFNYTVVATGGVTGFTTPQNGLPKDQVIADVLHNPTDAPQTVTYTIVPISPTGCSAGPTKVVVITINPTPQVVPSTLTQTICNDGTTSVTLASPSSFTSGVITFNYTVVATGGVTGFTTPQNGLAKDHLIADVLHNPTDAPQTVTYTIVPISPTGCAAGPSKVVVITVNPTPQVVPSTLAQTICDNGTTNVTLGSPSTFSNGLITFNYTAIATGGVTGFTSPVTGLPKDHVIADVLHNPTDAPQTVTYTVVPRSPSGCSSGPTKIVIITVNPTPRISPIPANTTQCDKITTNIQLVSPSTFTTGLITFKYTVTSSGGVTGYSITPVTGLPNNFIIADNLVNSTDHFQTVTYNVIPVSPTGCSDGSYINITVTVNPTPRAVLNNLVPAICYAGTIAGPLNTQVVLTSPTVMTTGSIIFDYTVTTTGGPGIVIGNTTPAVNLPLNYTINYSYQNNSDILQYVKYFVTPKNNAICVPGQIVESDVTVHAKPLQSILVTNALECDQSSDAALRAMISSGADPYHIVWNGPVGYHREDVTDIINLAKGRYFITVTDNLACRTDGIQDISAYVTKLSMVMETALPYPPKYNLSCIGATDGKMTISVLDGITPPYSFSLVKNDVDILYTGVFSDKYDAADPSTYMYYTGLGAGKYTLIIHDVNGCETTWSDIMREPPPMVATFNKSQYDGGYNVSCKGYNNGSISIQNTTGGRGGYTYRWYTFDGTIPGPINLNHIDNLTAGTYYVEITDVTPCVTVQSTVITEPGGMQLTGYQLSKSPDGNFNISCNGGNDGSISMTITGGSGNYVFSWTGPPGFTSTSKDLTGLKAGVYNCTVRDLNGCLLTPSPSFTLTEPTPLVFSSLTTSMAIDGTHNINCYGTNTGWINLSVTGGIAGTYVYDWSTADGNGIVNGNKDQVSLTAGTYHIRVTDGNNCILGKDITLTQPPQFSSQLSAANITCKSPGFNNGSIILTVTGGSAPYSYLWSNGATTKDISGLTQGNYNVIITDLNGCVMYNAATIDLPPDLSYNRIIPDYNGFNISCNGQSDGSIQVDPTSGAPPFNYTWTGPGGFTAATKNISGLRAGQYHLLITDINECKVSDVFDLTEPAKLDINFTLSESSAGGYNINCAGDNTGSIDVVPVNQVMTVDYLWADGIFGKTRNNLPAGNYSLIITDANNCHASASVTLTAPDSLKDVLMVTPPFCPDKPDGKIDANVTGGVKGTDYSYIWSDNSSNKSLLNIPEGYYKVTISDLNGCSKKDSVIVTAQNQTCLVIPNAISPNGDLINDVWNIGLKELYPNMEVKIFNRWGESIWKSARGYPEPWDGTSNGRSLPIDSYHYIIDLHDGSKPIVGNITIVK